MLSYIMLFFGTNIMLFTNECCHIIPLVFLLPHFNLKFYSKHFCSTPAPRSVRHLPVLFFPDVRASLFIHDASPFPSHTLYLSYLIRTKTDQQDQLYLPDSHISSDFMLEATSMGVGRQEQPTSMAKEGEIFRRQPTLSRLVPATHVHG
jgi:hypothetical protein